MDSWSNILYAGVFAVAVEFGAMWTVRAARGQRHSPTQSTMDRIKSECLWMRLSYYILDKEKGYHVDFVLFSFIIEEQRRKAIQYTFERSQVF